MVKVKECKLKKVSKNLTDISITLEGNNQEHICTMQVNKDNDPYQIGYNVHAWAEALDKATKDIMAGRPQPKEVTSEE